MDLTCWEMTMRISNAHEILHRGILEQVNRQLDRFVAGQNPLVWCLYHDYLILEIRVQAGADENWHQPKSGIDDDFSQVIEELVRLLFDYEMTAWLFYENQSGCHYITYFNNYHSSKLTITSSDFEYEFGDYK